MAGSGISAPFEWGSDLTAEDLKNLERRWITPDLACQMWLRRVTGDEGAAILSRRHTSGDYAGIVIPNIWPGEAGPRGYRIRCDHPETETKKNGTRREKHKYLSASGDRNMLFFPPGTDPVSLSDPTLDIVIVEGEFKSGASFRLARHGISPSDPRPRFLASALPGVWNFRGKCGKTTGPRGESLDVKGPIPDLDRILWDNRKVIIVFDANVQRNESVAAARRVFTSEIQNRDAKVFWVDLPEEPGVNGVDDLLYRKGPELVLYLIEHAAPAKPPRKRITIRSSAGPSLAPSVGPTDEQITAKPDGMTTTLSTLDAFTFDLRQNGLYYLNPGRDKEPMWICSRIEVMADSRDPSNKRWGRLVEVTDGDGIVHRLILPNTLFAGDEVDLRKELLDLGANIRKSKEAHDLLSLYLRMARPEKRVRSIQKIGWYGDAYILPDRTFGLTGSEEFFYEAAQTIEDLHKTRGTIEDWRTNIAAVAAGNSRLILPISAAFAGLLLKRLGIPGGGLHSVGRSSLGKSTALMAAGSVLGGGGKYGFVRSWKSTINGLEPMCEAHNDLTLMLDEIRQASQHDVVEAAYMIANGIGKARQAKTLQLRGIPSWTLLLLSSGEETIEEIAARSGQKVPGGALVRLPAVPADAGVGKGIFEDIHSAASPRDFANQLKTAAAKYYGTPIRAFLDRLIRDRTDVERRWQQFKDGFLLENVPKGAGEEIGRAAELFAVVAYAGRLATEWGITGWNEEEAERAAASCFSASIQHRRTLGPSDIERGIAQVVLALERFGASRFDPLSSAVDGSEQIRSERALERYGYRREREDGSTDYLIQPEVFRAQLCKDYDHEAIAKELAIRGHLRRDGKHLTYPHTIPGIGRPRFYTVNSSIFGHEQIGLEEQRPSGQVDDPGRRGKKPHVQ